MRKIIRGSKGGKGGGGGGRAPVEAPDSIRSRAYARIIDLICEGEVEGLIDGNKSIYLDGTQLQNADGTYNFSGVTVVTRNGTQGQSYIPGFSEVENELQVGILVTNVTPVVRTATNSNLNAIRVTVSVQALTLQDTGTGDINGASVDFVIDLQSNGGGYVTKVTDTIQGKTTSRYQRSHRIQLTGSPPWDIRVRRVTADTNLANLQDKIYFDSYAEIIEAKLSYPNSALAAISVDAAQFRSIPTIAYDMKLMRVRVPSNYNPATRTYTGSWDGTFQVAWTDNPAWCFYDLLTSTRYGLGEFIPDLLADKWALYTIGKYCDELVPNGFGGTEPRFTCNIYLQEQQDAYKVLADMASIFRGMIFWSSGIVTASQDAPADPVALFANANVLSGEFTYSGSSLKSRATVALVTWNDPANFYRQTVEYVENRDAIATLGYNQKQVTAIGCTSRGQAHRVGQWILLSEQMADETVTFRTGMEGMTARPGQVIKVTDANRNGVRWGGRITAATSLSVTLDSAVTLQSGQTYHLSLIAPDGSVIDNLAVTNGIGTLTTLNFPSALAQTPQVQSIWILQSDQVNAQLFRIIAAPEVEKNIVEVTALAHHPDKYAAIEQGITLQPRNITSLTLVPASPQNIRASEYLYETLNAVGVGLNISWDALSSGVNYEITYTRDNDNWTIVRDIQSTAVDLRNIQEGVYDIVVYAVNAANIKSPGSPFRVQVYGKTLPPTRLTGVTMQAISSLAVIRWDQHVDLDVRVGGWIHIRHSSLLSGATWENSLSITDAVAGNATMAAVPLKEGTYLLKAQDSSGNFSANYVSIASSAATVLDFTSIGTVQEDAAFFGTHSGTAAASGILKLAGVGMFDDMPSMDGVPSIDSYGGVAASGTYTFATGFDFGTVKRVRLETLLEAVTVNVNDFFDIRSASVDDWLDFDGAGGGSSADAWVEVRTTNDDPNASPTWSAWNRIDIADFNCRAVDKPRCILQSYDPAYNIHLSKLRITAKELA